MIGSYFPAYPRDHWTRVPDSALPDCDPWGYRWSDMSADELRERSGWCMTSDRHEALRRARMDRAEVAS